MISKLSAAPLVSVIIPTFNRSYLLRRAIVSVLNQSYLNKEVIVIDDGSTDDTESMIAGLGKEKDQIIYFKKSNGGCASARNKGLAMARGDYISFLDSDDEWVPTTLVTFIKTLSESGAELVYSPSIEVDQYRYERISYPVAAGEPRNLAEKHFMSTNVRNGSYMFARSVMEKVGYLDETLKYNEDSDFFQRLSIQCVACYSPTPSVKVYEHPGNKSQNRVEIYRALLKSSQKVLNENPIFAEKLGGNAIKRLRQIKTQLVEALLFRGNFLEANSIAKDIFVDLRIIAKIAIRLNNNLLLKCDYSIRSYLGSIKKYIFKKYFQMIKAAGNR
jgi:glycosyltransferase involved in cell wall biosynthesis